MKGRVYVRCVRSSMTYGSETMPLLVDVEEDVRERVKCYEEEVQPYRKTDYKPIIIRTVSHK